MIMYLHDTLLCISEQAVPPHLIIPIAGDDGPLCSAHTKVKDIKQRDTQH